MNAIIALLGGVRATIFAGLMLLFLGTSVYLNYKHKLYVADVETKTAVAQEKAREKEKDWIDAVYKIAYELTEKRLAREKALKDDFAAIDRGDNKLRPRFACVPNTSKAQPGNDGAGEAGIQKADEKFLISESDHADRIVDKLTACQEHVRKIMNGL